MPTYSGVWNLQPVYQAVAQGQWPSPPFGYLLTFTSTNSTNNLQSEVSVIDTTTGISYLIFNCYPSSTSNIRVAAVNSSGTILWAKTFGTNNSTDIYATDSSQTSTHLFIACNGSGQGVVLKIAKSDGSVTAANKIGTSNDFMGITVDPTNNRFYISYVASSAHQVGCFNADTFASVWSPLAITYSGVYTVPTVTYQVGFNQSNSTAYGLFQKYDDTGNIQENHAIIMTGSGVSSARKISVNLNRNFRGMSFDGSNNLIASGGGYMASYSSDLTTVNWGRSLTVGLGMSENSFSNGKVYPWGNNGRFRQFDTSNRTVPWSYVLETGPGAAYQEAYVNGAAVYGDYAFLCWYQDNATAGKNAYVLRYPVAGGFTGLINSTAEIVSGSTTVNTSTPTTASASLSSSSSGRSFTTYSELTTTTWSYTSSLTTFIA